MALRQGCLPATPGTPEPGRCRHGTAPGFVEIHPALSGHLLLRIRGTRARRRIQEDVLSSADDRTARARPCSRMGWPNRLLDARAAVTGTCEREPAAALPRYELAELFGRSSPGVYRLVSRRSAEELAMTMGKGHDGIRARTGGNGQPGPCRGTGTDAASDGSSEVWIRDCGRVVAPTRPAPEPRPLRPGGKRHSGVRFERGIHRSGAGDLTLQAGLVSRLTSLRCGRLDPAGRPCAPP